MITATGLGSGLDIDTLVQSIVDAERVPLMARVDAREDHVDSLISGYGIMQTNMSAIQDAVTILSDTTSFGITKAESSLSSSVAVSVTSAAQPGEYEIDVSQLAQTQSLVGGGFAASTDIVGSGTLTIAIGTPTYNASPDDSTYASFNQTSSVDITIAADSTLADVRDAINAANAGVNASILYDGSQYRLMINGETSGINQGIAITVSGDGSGTDTDSSGLSQLAFNGTTANLSQVRAPMDAALSINGLSLTATSNSVSNVVDGVTLNLSELTSTSVSVSVSSDTATLKSYVDDFVTAYNTYLVAQKELTAYDATTGDSGSLQGDAMERTMVSQLRELIAEEVTGLTGTISTLTDLGITVQDDGTLLSDETTLDQALQTNLTDVEEFFLGATVAGVAVSGFATKLDTLLDSFLDTDGLLVTKLSSLDDRLTDIEEDRDLYTRRMDALEARYFSQFNAMDTLLGQITSTGDMLQTQLDALPGYQNLRQSGNR